MGRAELRFLWAPIWPHSNCKCRLRLTLFGKFITLVFICCERRAPRNILFSIGPMWCKIWWENSWDMSFGPKSGLQFNFIDLGEFANLPSPTLKPKCHFLTHHNEWMSSWLWPYLPPDWFILSSNPSPFQNKSTNICVSSPAACSHWSLGVGTREATQLNNRLVISTTRRGWGGTNQINLILQLCLYVLLDINLLVKKKKGM